MVLSKSQNNASNPWAGDMSPVDDRERASQSGWIEAWLRCRSVNKNDTLARKFPIVAGVMEIGQGTIAAPPVSG